MYQYPYGNAQQLNLDWILNKLQEIEAQGATPSSADLKMIVNAVLSASYDSSSAYDVSDIVFNDSLSKLYRCNTAIPAGGEAWNAAHWDEILLAPVVSNLVVAVANMSSDDVFNSSTVAGIHVTDALDALSAAVTAAAQAAVTNVRYNSHKLQQRINGSYSDIITIEDTPSNNSGRLASSKAAYDLNSAITSLSSAITSVENKVDNKILYFVNLPVSVASNAEIFRITDDTITTAYVVLECYFTNRGSIEGDVTWTSYNGYMSFTGTCTSATTANVVVAQRKP